MNKTNAELLKQLNDLMDIATSKASKNCDFAGDKEKQERYREFCFGEIWEEFWETTYRITGVPDNCCDPDTTYEEDMRAYLERAKLCIS